MSEKTVVEGGLPQAGNAAVPITVPKGMSIDEFKAQEAARNTDAPPPQTGPARDKPAPEQPQKPQEPEEFTSLADMLSSPPANVGEASGSESAPPAKKLSIAKLKEIEEDLEDDEQVVERLSSYKQKVKDLEILAAGRDAIEADDQIKGFNMWLKASDENLFIADEATRFKKAGLSDEEATARAKARYDKLVKENPDAIEDKVLDVRSRIGEMIDMRKKDLAKSLEETSKAYNFADILNGKNVLTNLGSSLSKTTEFLGMKISEDKTERSKLLSEAEQFAKSGELKQALSNPETLAEVALFLKYRKQWETAVRQRTNGKAKVVDKLPKVPPSGSVGGRVNPAATNSGKKGQFNPSGWR
jgi:hypothetical protein